MLNEFELLDEITSLDWKPEVGNFAGTIAYLTGATMETLIDIKRRRQWTNIEKIIKSAIYKKNYGCGGGRSLWRFKYFTKGLEIKGYSGRPQNACYTTRDEPLPSHDPNIDNAILASYSTTSPEAVKGAKIFAEQGVNTSLITGTTPKMLEDKRKKEGWKESAWEYLKKQKDWKRQVVYLFQKEDEEKEQLAALNTEFEFKLGPVSIGFANCIGLYHDIYDVIPGRYEESEAIPLKTISDTIESFYYYIIKRLVPSFNKNQDLIYKLIQLILEANEIRHVSPYLNSIEGKCLEIRLGTLGYNKREGKSVKAITSENYGSEGSSDLKPDTLLILNALEGTEVFANQISREAKKKKVNNIVYVGDPDSGIAKNATMIIPIPEMVHRYHGVISLCYPSVGLLYDGVTSQIKHDLGYTEGKMREEHSQHD